LSPCLVDEQGRQEAEWFDSHSRPQLTNWIEANLAEHAESFELGEVASLYDSMAAYDVIGAHLWADPPTLPINYGDELVARSAHLTAKKLGRTRNPKLHGHAPAKADPQVYSSFQLLRGRKLASADGCRKLSECFGSYPDSRKRAADTVEDHVPSKKTRTANNTIERATEPIASEVAIFAGTTVQEACDALVPYSSRPREVVQCRGFQKALVIKAPVPFTGRAPSLESFQDLLQKFDESSERVPKMKKLTLLTFTMPGASALQVWLQARTKIVVV